MSLLLGLAFGAGVLLTISPWLWPARPATTKRSSGFSKRIEEQLKVAGFGNYKASGLVVVSLVLGFVAGALSFLLIPVLGLACVISVAAASSPLLFVNRRARVRRKANRQVWPDLVDQLVSAVRAGLSLPDSLSTLAETGPASTRALFAEFRSDFEASGNFERCINLLKDRLSDPIADRILETLRMARQVGGSELPNLLRTLSSHLRQELSIRGEVEARQSWVVNAARLGAIAPWVILALLSTRPEGAAAYNSPAGTIVILFGLLATVIAYRAMITIARLPEERRWFG